jgi:beta-galactosidase
MMKMQKQPLGLLLALLLLSSPANSNPRPGRTASFNDQWQFNLGDVQNGHDPGLDDSRWRTLNLPHDWSIEGQFSEKHPATPGGGALPGGIGWYRKTFTLPVSAKGKLVFVDFDGVYRNSEVWINGQHLGKRPNGYISFRYEMSPYLKYGAEKNVIAVKVDNSKQPNSRWYSGSGVYRNVWLTVSEKTRVEHWGTFITTPEVSEKAATVKITTTVRNDSDIDTPATLMTIILNSEGKEVARSKAEDPIARHTGAEIRQEIKIAPPTMWSVDNPYLYTAVSEVVLAGKVVDRYETRFGIRHFVFDREKGFILNGKVVKILGVCNHHDLGSLGAAVNTRALERQLELLREMGVNGIRTSHNPPAPELLELCDRMGFIVMDEAFDMWKKKKNDFDYHLDWDEWHKRDLEHLVRRDRNHPSVFIWSIGNEISEQWGGDAAAGTIGKELTSIVRGLDSTRPITAAINFVDDKNTLISNGGLDLVGINYAHDKILQLPKLFPGRTFIGTETVSALATRGSYDLPSDVIRRWPPRWDLPLKRWKRGF